MCSTKFGMLWLLIMDDDDAVDGIRKEGRASAKSRQNSWHDADLMVAMKMMISVLVKREKLQWIGGHVSCRWLGQYIFFSFFSDGE